MTSLTRRTAQRLQDELREFMAFRPATEEAARDEGERVHRALAERNQRSARDQAAYAGNPDGYVWLAALNMLDLFDREEKPDRLEALRRLDAYTASLAGSADRPPRPSAVVELQRCFHQLPPECQAVLQLCQHYELSPTEIATRVGTSVLAVQELLVAALCALDTEHSSA